jgi:small nuclear ribonucleoprotein (snRNP)-like protein
MENSFERPLDLLNAARGKRVLVETKAKKQIMGVLKAFDIHINIVLADAEERDEQGQVARKIGDVFIRGDMIVLVAPSP